MVITSTPPPDPTSRHSSSSIPASETATTSADLDSAGDCVDPPIHDQPWIEPFGRGTQCWVNVVGGKKKERVYNVGKLAANYTTARGGTLKHQPSSSTTTTDEAVERLTRLLQQRDQENRDLRDEYSSLRHEFTNFKFLVMRALPKAAQLHSTVPLTQLPITCRSLAAHINPTHISPAHTSLTIYRALR
ncbi:hypothetical protein LR48_Vigan01g124000 [Vigna angularis]|uniref:Uncharacterized protein n=1 Tax=Phaseolus angularis TaxID=3914 RepID=A0A0L9TM99_PHAAN|nr:hypothetical protein LR48_Vigan01g124000 [Vigna angularis]